MEYDAEELWGRLENGDMKLWEAAEIFVENPEYRSDILEYFSIPELIQQISLDCPYLERLY